MGDFIPSAALKTFSAASKCPHLSLKELHHSPSATKEGRSWAFSTENDLKAISKKVEREFQVYNRVNNNRFESEKCSLHQLYHRVVFYYSTALFTMKLVGPL